MTKVHYEENMTLKTILEINEVLKGSKYHLDEDGFLFKKFWIFSVYIGFVLDIVENYPELIFYVNSSDMFDFGQLMEHIELEGILDIYIKPR